VLPRRLPLDPTQLPTLLPLSSSLFFMTKYLLLGLSLALAGCTTQKALPHYTEAEKAAQRQAIGYWQPAPTKPDSTSGPRV
jgi:hypothetical protein